MGTRSHRPANAGHRWGVHELAQVRLSTRPGTEFPDFRAHAESTRIGDTADVIGVDEGDLEDRLEISAVTARLLTTGRDARTTSCRGPWPRR